MELGFNSFTGDQEDRENSPENSGDSPPSSFFYDTKTTSTSSPKRSRRAKQKRVVSVPFKDVERSRLKGETNAPPSDSWAWRKYGQKPIKGSPYPRGYYRCSSSKGCPARKQVERSRTDPSLVVVTYSSEHNHSRTNNHHNSAASPPVAATSTTTEPIIPNPLKPEPEEKFTNLEVGPFGTAMDRFGWWFSDFDSTSPAMLESPLMAREITEDAEMAMIFSIREDEESFFADLGELPECTTVFRRNEAEHRRRQTVK